MDIRYDKENVTCREDGMTDNAFKEKELKPDDSGMTEKLGSVFIYWQEIQKFAVDNLGATSEEWKFYGAKYGWQLKTFLKKRNLFFLIAHEGFFKIGFIFGNKAVDAIEESEVAEDLKAEIRNAKKYAEGRGLAIEVKDGIHIPDIKKLLEIKVNN
jgi:hypothetical protein